MMATITITNNSHNKKNWNINILLIPFIIVYILTH